MYENLLAILGGVVVVLFLYDLFLGEMSKGFWPWNKKK